MQVFAVGLGSAENAQVGVTQVWDVWAGQGACHSFVAAGGCFVWPGQHLGCRGGRGWTGEGGDTPAYANFLCFAALTPYAVACPLHFGHATEASTQIFTVARPFRPPTC